MATEDTEITEITEILGKLGVLYGLGGQPSAIRYLCDGPADGAWNMAVDEALLESAAEHGVPALRFYEWSHPTLSLGYFQSLADRAAHAPSLNCPVVRRASGGGGILHDRELTYSLAVPRLIAGAHHSTWLYAAVHDALIAALAACGTAAQRVLEAPTLPRREQPFLCFERRAEHDVLIGSAKVAGSAQRRHRDAVLQHGSLLLARSASAPELPGVEDVAPQTGSPEAIRQAWALAVAGHLGQPLEVSRLTQSEVARAGQIAQERYANTAWTQRR